ncbi:MAG: MBOAT family O-acyltransferase [Janthinobacterium lividum]
MLFPTLSFLLFFTVVVAVLAMLDGPAAHGWRKRFLVLASYWFYAQWDWRFCVLLFGSSVWTYGAGLLLGRLAGQGARKAVVAVAVAGHLLLLGLFKYADFFVESMNSLLHRMGLLRELPFVEFILPVGISFFTFHGISYVVDVYRRQVEVCRRLEDMLLYISFFPQLVAGPIVRAAFFLPQLYAATTRRFDPVPAVLLILGGLFKKVVVANYLATDLVDKVFADPGHVASLDLLLAGYGYAVQIYCDFSAYTDIAIGIAALLGYAFPPNFDQPYRAENLQDFWRRWHISLSSWLRDYLYKPLGGSRRGRVRTLVNLMVTMLLGGIWHGAAWKFVAWGALHGGGLVVGRAVQPLGLFRGAAGRAVAIVLTFHFVCFAWLFFRADSFETVMLYLAQLFRMEGGPLLATPFTLGLIVLGLLMHAVPRDHVQRVAAVVRPLRWWGLAALAAVVVVAIDALGPEGVAPFIYFRF